MKNLKLKAARAAMGLSQQGLADRCGVSRQTIVAIEKGDYNPTINLCRADLPGAGHNAGRAVLGERGGVTALLVILCRNGGGKARAGRPVRRTGTAAKPPAPGYAGAPCGRGLGSGRSFGRVKDGAQPSLIARKDLNCICRAGVLQ